MSENHLIKESSDMWSIQNLIIRANRESTLILNVCTSNQNC